MAVVLAAYKQDVTERQRRIVAMRLQTDELSDVYALVEQVACSWSAKAAPEVMAQGCALACRALAHIALSVYACAGIRAGWL